MFEYGKYNKVWKNVRTALFAAIAKTLRYFRFNEKVFKVF